MEFGCYITTGMERISHKLKIWYICFIRQDNYSTCIYERSLQLYIGIIFKRASLCFCRGWLQAVWLTSVLHWFTMTSIVIEIFPKVVLMLVNCLLALNILPVVNIVMCNIMWEKLHIHVIVSKMFQRCLSFLILSDLQTEF